MIPELVTIVTTFIIGTWLTSVYTALKGISWGSIRKLDQKRDRALIVRAEQWVEMRNNYRILLRLLVFLNLACLAVAVYRIADFKLGDEADLLLLLAITAVTSYLFVLITEMISVRFTSQVWWVLKASMPVIHGLYYGFWIATWPAIFVHKQLERQKDSDDEEEKTTTEDEIEALLDHDAHSREGEPHENGIEERTGRMIRGILDLDETLVKEIMTPRVDVVAVQIDLPLAQVRRAIVQSGHSRIPVYRKNIDDVVGVIYSKNMLDDMNISADTSIEEIMRHPVYIPETKNVNELLQEFKQRKVHIAIVIDEYGGTAGIVSLEDILEEIVGEIADEFDDADEEDQILNPTVDGRLELEGRTPLDDVNDVLKLSIPEEEDNVTIGGYITSHLGRIPQSGETVELDEFSAEIIKADERKIEHLILSRRDVESPVDTEE